MKSTTTVQVEQDNKLVQFFMEHSNGVFHHGEEIKIGGKKQIKCCFVFDVSRETSLEPTGLLYHNTQWFIAKNKNKIVAVRPVNHHQSHTDDGKLAREYYIAEYKSVDELPTDGRVPDEQPKRELISEIDYFNFDYMGDDNMDEFDKAIEQFFGGVQTTKELAQEINNKITWDSKNVTVAVNNQDGSVELIRVTSPRNWFEHQQQHYKNYVAETNKIETKLSKKKEISKYDREMFKLRLKYAEALKYKVVAFYNKMMEVSK